MNDIECYFYGVWKRAGHTLFAPHFHMAPTAVWHELVHGSRDGGIDGVWAPRRFGYTNDLLWLGEYPRADRQRIDLKTHECPQGQFLHHELPCGFSIIQWWDRCQGDDRAACNSSILARGVHSAQELLSIGRDNFPVVFENLARHQVELVEVQKPRPEG